MISLHRLKAQAQDGFVAPSIHASENDALHMQAEREELASEKLKCKAS